MDLELFELIHYLLVHGLSRGRRQLLSLDLFRHWLRRTVVLQKVSPGAIHQVELPCLRWYGWRNQGYGFPAQFCRCGCQWQVQAVPRVVG